VNHLVFDTETTGLMRHPRAKDSVQPRIIEWGGALVDGQGRVLEELNLLINPGQPLPAEIVKITGITDADLADQPRFGALAPQLHVLFARADVLIAHNLPFDRGLMALELARAAITDWPWPARQVCTVQEHAEEWGRRPKLTELYEHYMGVPLAQSHRALDDVHALIQVCMAAGVLR